MIYFLAFTALLGLAMALAVFGLCRGLNIPMPWEVKWSAQDEPTRIVGLRKCPACGEIYHKSWGRICANCSGAD